MLPTDDVNDAYLVLGKCRFGTRSRIIDAPNRDLRWDFNSWVTDDSIRVTFCSPMSLVDLVHHSALIGSFKEHILEGTHEKPSC